VKAKEEQKAAKESQSFTMNMFRGQLNTNQVFPYPEVLTEDQSDTLKMLVDPVTKFFDVRIILNYTNSNILILVNLLI
jgi:hypothetical protein